MTTARSRTGFGRLLAAQAISSLGDWLATFALMSLVLDISGSTAAVGAVLALRFVPAAVAGPLIGFAASRWGRRSLLVRLDLIRAGAALLIPIVSSLWWVYSWSLVLETATVIAVAARDASIRDLVEEPRLPVANGLVMGATYGAIPLGAGAFTVISLWAQGLPFGLSFLQAQPAFWVDGLTFLLSAWLVRGIVAISDRLEASVVAGEHVRLRDAWLMPLVRGTLAPILAASVGIGTVFSLGIALVRETLGASEAQFGILVVAFGIGALVGLALRQLRAVAGVRAVRFGVTSMGLAMVMIALASELLPAMIVAVLFGAGGALAIVSGITVLQEDLPAESRLMALGAFHVAIRVALAAGGLAAGLAVDLIGRRELAGLVAVRLVLLGAGALVIVSSLVVRTSGRSGS
jgi:MFS family permease